MKPLDSKVLFREIQSYAIITLGLFINALGWAAFLIPSSIVGGGITGVSQLIFYSTGIPVSIMFMGINVILIIIAIKMLGAGFGFKTIYAIFVLSGFFALLQHFITEPIIKEKFMSCLLGGMLGGAGIGIVFTQGGSTGGTDIIAMVINKYRNYSPGKILLALDFIIITSSYFLFGSIEVIVYGIVAMGVASYTIDLLLVGSKQSVQLFIFSKNNAQIADKITTEAKRGVTMLNGKGWFTKEEQEVLVVVVKKNELQNIFRLVKECDNQAFISVAQVMGVYGKGFDQIR